MAFNLIGRCEENYDKLLKGIVSREWSKQRVLNKCFNVKSILLNKNYVFSCIVQIYPMDNWQYQSSHPLRTNQNRKITQIFL